MPLINSVKRYLTKCVNPKEVILLCGFGGAVWQTKRLRTVLNRAGYNVTALDFSKRVLSKGDPTLLPKLVEEVVIFAEEEAKKTDEKILLIGISLGSLLSLNIFRRTKAFDKAIMITGGNIVTVAQNIYGDKVWPQGNQELSEAWKDLNIFTDPKLLSGKHALFVLPTKDTLIDTSEVVSEIETQLNAGNNVLLVKRNSFGHIGTIIEETILFPRRILDYIEKVEASSVSRPK